jgi:hypothetical protein
MHTYSFDDALFARLQKHAIPLVDTLGDVISRALDALEQTEEKAGAGSADSDISHKKYDGQNPPNLTHTSLLAMSVGGKLVLKGVSWNGLMVEVIRTAGKQGWSGDKLLALMEVPAEIGESNHYSYTFVSEANLSVQGQNANRAWKQAYRIAKEVGLPIQASWVWQHKPHASEPGVKGQMSYRP